MTNLITGLLSFAANITTGRHFDYTSKVRIIHTIQILSQQLGHCKGKKVGEEDMLRNSILTSNKPKRVKN